MRVFFVSQRVPYPPDRGDKITTFHEVRHLSLNHEVHVFGLVHGEDDLRNVPGVERYAQSVTAVPLDKTRAKWRSFASLARKQPFTIGYFQEARLDHAIRTNHRTLRPDVILVYSSGVASMLNLSRTHRA